MNVTLKLTRTKTLEKTIVRPCGSFEYSTHVNEQYLFIDAMYNMTLGQENQLLIWQFSNYL